LYALQIQAGASFCGKEISAIAGWSLAVESRLDFTVYRNRPLNYIPTVAEIAIFFTVVGLGLVTATVQQKRLQFILCILSSD